MDTVRTQTVIPRSISILLEGAVDYAGLFPPSRLSMPEAVINYATYKYSNYSWMLGRFVVGSDHLEEFFLAASDFIGRDIANIWQIAVVAGDNVFEAIRKIDDLNAVHSPYAVCDVLETKVSTAAEIEKIADALPPSVTAYFEIDPTSDLDEMITAISSVGQRAKLRTGGITPESFPTSSSIVDFVKRCAESNVAFKATAGLHHPLRCFHPLTYDEDSVKGTMHGFLNLFIMSGFAQESFRQRLLEDVMEEEFEEVFSFDDNGLSWRGEYKLNLNQIAELRKHGIQSFGSCSFDEPVTDLQNLGIL